MNKEKETIQCPACGKIHLKVGLKNHIINAAKSEVWKNTENKPHKEYFDANQIKVDENKFIIK